MAVLPFDLDDTTWQVPAEVVGIGEPHQGVWQCPRCQATWVADHPEWCGWCCRRWVAQQRAQATLDLIPPDWDSQIEGWVKRLTISVAAGRLTPEQAARAVARHRGRLRNTDTRTLPGGAAGSSRAVDG